MTEIKKCTCNHKYQDAKYGYGKRVCNRKQSGGWRCTVCGKDLLNTITKKKGKK